MQRQQKSFRERLRKAGAIKELFEMFEEDLRDQGLEARIGQIIDATLVLVPKQRNTREENKESRMFAYQMDRKKI